MEEHISPQNGGDQPISNSLRGTLLFYMVSMVGKLFVWGLAILSIAFMAGIGAQRYGSPNYVPLIIFSVLLLGFNGLVAYHIYRALKGNVGSVKFLIAVAVIDAIIALVVSFCLIGVFGIASFLVGLLIFFSYVALVVYLDKGISR